MKKLLLITMLSIGLFAETVVVVNPGAGFDSMSADQIKRVFLAKEKTLPDGKRAVLVDNEKSSNDFYKKAIGKSASKMNKYWVKLTFTGKAEAPKKLSDSKAVADFVKKTDGAIGYVNSADATGLKTVFTVK